MKTSLICTLLLTAPVMTALSQPSLPRLLKDWTGWVTWDESRNEGKVTPFDNPQEVLPIWYSPVEIEANGNGGRFAFTVDASDHEWAPLPGDARTWPQQVTVDGQPATVVSRGGIPCIEFRRNQSRTIEGRFRWTNIPQSIRIPPEIGVLNLQLNGQRTELPVWDAQNRLWLQRTSAEPADKDFLSINVYRLISDGSPQWLTTRVELSVAGKSREETLGNVLPEGWRLSSVEAPLPCAIDDQGRLKVQVRPGKWNLEISAFRTIPAETVAFADNATPLTATELVGLKPDPSFRLVEITGIPAVDVAQTTFPDPWRSHPVHQWRTDEPFQLDEKMRGMGVRKPQGISIRRSFWLDEDGKNLTYQDHLKGSGQQTWRLDVADGHQLGAVKMGGVGQLITRNPSTGSEGIEIRNRNLELQAVGRLPRSARMAATGWQHDAETLEARMNLPPGWRLLAIFGTDWSRGDWLTSWSLFDVFILLIVTLAIWKTWGWKTALIGLLGLLIAYHERNAPRVTMVLLVTVFAAAKWIPQGTATRLVRSVKIIALLLFAINVIPFTIQQIQQALYPQLESYRSSWQPEVAQTFDFETDGAVSAAPEPMQGIRNRVGSAMQEVASLKKQAYYKRSEKANLQYDTKARIQTGPAVPQWKWREVSFGWRGPVAANETLSLWLIPCNVERLITVARIGLMFALVWLLLGRGKALPNWPRKASTTAASLIFLLTFVTGTASAQAQLPSKELLDQLRERVLADQPLQPQRAEIPNVQLTLNGHRLDMKVEIHATETVAVPLPGKLPSWSPVTISDDLPTLRHEEYLWVLAQPGVQTVEVTGLIPPGAEWQWSFRLKPRQVQITADGWKVAGVNPNGVPENQVFFVEVNRRASTEAAYDQKDFFPVVRIERALELGLVWEVKTTVRRLSPVGKAISINVPLLPGERVMSSGITAEQGRADVRFGASAREVSWTSELAPVEQLKLQAETSQSWVERWTLTVSPVWNVRTEGLEPIYETQQAQLIPVWSPWPGEEVLLQVSRPDAVQGATTTVHKARQETRLGDRQQTTELSLTVQASLGEDFAISLPEKAAITSLKVRGQELPVRREGANLIIPVRPGDQELQVAWKTPGALGLSTPSDAVALPVLASNITTSITVPSSRWVLWASGPTRGPAVRFWGFAIAALFLGFIMARIPLSPLRSYEWALLLLGFMQLPLFVGSLVVLWFFVISWRGRNPNAIEVTPVFNLFQLILTGTSILALLSMLGVVHQGLLGTPEMFITGYGSSTGFLQWFQDRTPDGKLPQPIVLSVSIWVYRALMLAWALWLANRVLHWFPWTFRQLNEGTFWRRSKAKAKPTTPPPLQQ